MSRGYKPEELWGALRGLPGTFALTVGSASLGTIDHLSCAWDTPITDVSRFLTSEHQDGWENPEQVLRNRRLLVGLDVLFWPELMIDPLRLLRSLASHNPVVAQWPGQVSDIRATYSDPGRPDYYDNPLPKGILVLRSHATTFPDELPYSVERT